jgi:hypothetical protein
MLETIFSSSERADSKLRGVGDFAGLGIRVLPDEERERVA